MLNEGFGVGKDLIDFKNVKSFHELKKRNNKRNEIGVVWKLPNRLPICICLASSMLRLIILGPDF